MPKIQTRIYVDHQNVKASTLEAKEIDLERQRQRMLEAQNRFKNAMDLLELKKVHLDEREVMIEKRVQKIEQKAVQANRLEKRALELAGSIKKNMHIIESHREAMKNALNEFSGLK